MALQKAYIPLDISKGLNTKSDPKQLEAGYLTRAENVVYETLSKLKKRHGYDALTLEGISEDASDIVASNKLKNELLLMTRTSLYSYSEAALKWTRKGAIFPTNVQTDIVVKNSKSQTQVSSIVVEGHRITTWTDSSGSVRYSVQDTTTKSFLVSDAEVATGERPQVAHIQNEIYIIYGNSTGIYFKYFNLLAPATLTSATTIASNRDATNGLICATSGTNKVYVAYNSTASGAELRLFSISELGVASSIVGITGAVASNALTLMVDSLSRVLVGFSDGTTLKYIIYNAALGASLLAATSIEAAVTPVKNVTFIETGAGTYTAYYEVQQSGISNNYVKKANLTVGGTVSGGATFLRSVGLAARAFEHNDRIYITVVHESTLQSTFFMYDQDGALVTKFANQIAASVYTHGVLPEVYADDGSIYEIPHLIRNRTVADESDVEERRSALVYYSTSGVGVARLNFAPDSYYSAAALADSLHICAGILKQYDGATVAEHGFNVFPETLTQGTISITGSVTTSVAGVLNTTSEVQLLTFSYVPGAGTFTLTYGAETTSALAYNCSTADIKAAIEALVQIAGSVTVTGTFAAGFTITYANTDGNVAQPTVNSSLTTPTTGGFMSNGNYGYVATYSWTDNTGKRHISTPTAVGLEITLAGGGSTQQAAVVVPTLRLTEKSNVIIDLWRTEASGTTYYKVTSDTSPTANDKTVDTVTITDTLSDATLIAREALYTNAGALENIPAPAAFQVCVHNGDRLAVIGEASNRVFLSKLVDEGGPVEFTDAIYRDVDPSGGSLKTLRNMGDKLVLFSEDSTFAITGEGPNNLGQQDTFSQAEVVAGDIGCTSSESLALLPVGLMFQSRKGIYMLTPGLSMEYVGDRMEAYNSRRVTSAQVVGVANQVRFLLEESTALVFNYQLNKWATFENHGGLSSVVIGSDYYYVREDGMVYKENRSSFSDNSTPIRMRVETGWLSGVALQAVQRVYRALLLGDYKSAHKLRIKVAYDFVEAWLHEKLIAPSDFLTVSTYGEDSSYGSGTPYGGVARPYQVRIDFKRQKCQAIKLLIEDSQSAVGEGFSLSAITIRAGSKDTSSTGSTEATYGTE